MRRIFIIQQITALKSFTGPNESEQQVDGAIIGLTLYILSLPETVYRVAQKTGLVTFGFGI